MLTFCAQWIHSFCDRRATDVQQVYSWKVFNYLDKEKRSCATEGVAICHLLTTIVSCLSTKQCPKCFGPCDTFVWVKHLYPLVQWHIQGLKPTVPATRYTNKLFSYHIGIFVQWFLRRYFKIPLLLNIKIVFLCSLLLFDNLPFSESM